MGGAVPQRPRRLVGRLSGDVPGVPTRLLVRSLSVRVLPVLPRRRGPPCAHGVDGAHTPGLRPLVCDPVIGGNPEEALRPEHAAPVLVVVQERPQLLRVERRRSPIGEARNPVLLRLGRVVTLELTDPSGGAFRLVSSVRESRAPPRSTRAASMLTSLMSFTMTATRRPSRLFRTSLRRVVFPAPRKPDNTVTGRRSSRVTVLGSLLIGLPFRHVAVRGAVGRGGGLPRPGSLLGSHLGSWGGGSG